MLPCAMLSTKRRFRTRPLWWHFEPLITAASCDIARRRSRLAEGHRRRRREAALTAEHDGAFSKMGRMTHLTNNTVDQRSTAPQELRAAPRPGHEPGRKESSVRRNTSFTRPPNRP